MENLKRYIVGLNLSGNIERGLLKIIDDLGQGGKEYTEEEKIIGSINGKVLYEKTFFGTLIDGTPVNISNTGIIGKYVINRFGGINYDGFESFDDTKVYFGYSEQTEDVQISKKQYKVNIYDENINIIKEESHMKIDGTNESQDNNQDWGGKSYYLTVQYTKEWALTGNEFVDEQ